MTKVAAEGLDKSWLGREITSKDIDNLVKIHTKNQINIAGEGGEFETLMVDGPIFSKKIDVKVKDIVEEGLAAEVVLK
jgi:asparagine synthase (glutamine-hydrolysing)